MPVPLWPPGQPGVLPPAQDAGASDESERSDGCVYLPVTCRNEKSSLLMARGWVSAAVFSKRLRC